MTAATTRPDRRSLLKWAGAALASAPWLACSSGGGASNGGSGGTGGTAGDAAVGGDGAAGSWATGGTAVMTDKANYPNPFAGALPATCALTCTATQGPCYSAQAEMIGDISYGFDGLPMRMALRVLDDGCQPVVGAVVDVWHTAAVGKYSGNDSANENVAFCTGNDADFASHLYFRGKQVTDADGVVFFDSCFPGWYPGRTIHVHFTITMGDRARVTSQFFFADTLADDIVANQPLYKDRGARDTTNQNDSVISAAAAADYLFQTQRLSDGAMLAWKTIIVRKDTAAGLCTVPGGGNAPGGPPPG